MAGGVAVSGASIAKLLASCNTTARNRAVRHLISWLPSSSSSDLSDADLLKIWKGLFYCVWHADKPPVQLDLINRLSSLLPSLPTPLASRYFDAFLSTIRREWPGIDVLRMDKYYLLIRRFVKHLLLLLSNHSWDMDLVSQFMTVLSKKCLLSTDKHQAPGVSYHISQVFLDELLDFLPVSLETVSLLLEPYLVAAQKSADRLLVNKIKTGVFDRLLENGTKLLVVIEGGEGKDVDSELEKLGKIALVAGLSKKFFESASATETLQGNRKVLFGLHDRFLKMDKDLEKSGVHVTMVCLKDGNVEKDATSEVVEGEELEERPAKKKRKKSKKADEAEKKGKSKKIKKDKSLVSGIGGNAMELEGLTDAFANGDEKDADDMIKFDEPIMSNLQKQFEKVAAEAGMMGNSKGLSDTSGLPVIPTVVKKRKRAKSTDRQRCASPGSANGGSVATKSGDKSAKKVSFSMKNNLVWKPHSPLPPQNLRVPPSATPRGSALKKGVPPGPVKEVSSMVKKAKLKSSSGKKARKGRTLAPAIKRLRKLQSFSL